MAEVVRWPWRRIEPPAPAKPDPVAVFEAAVEETSRWQRLTRNLIIEVGFDLNERYADVAHLERR